MWRIAVLSIRDLFLHEIRTALSRDPDGQLDPDPSTHLFHNADEVHNRAEEVLRKMAENDDTLITQFVEAAKRASWEVKQVEEINEARHCLSELLHNNEIKTVVRSAHSILEKLNIDRLENTADLDITIMASGDEFDKDSLLKKRQLNRKIATLADIGITGVDYAIAETGSCVIYGKKGVSRLVSLLPPIHIAVVEKRQVLPSLDELFTLFRAKFLNGDVSSYMNVITGPSRSGDIENTIITGVHGPRQTHMILIG